MPTPSAMYADLKNDFVFRRIFGNHPDLLAALLDDLLELTIFLNSSAVGGRGHAATGSGTKATLARFQASGSGFASAASIAETESESFISKLAFDEGSAGGSTTGEQEQRSKTEQGANGHENRGSNAPLRAPEPRCGRVENPAPTRVPPEPGKPLAMARRSRPPRTGRRGRAAWSGRCSEVAPRG